MDMHGRAFEGTPVCDRDSGTQDICRALLRIWASKKITLKHVRQWPQISTFSALQPSEMLLRVLSLSLHVVFAVAASQHLCCQGGLLSPPNRVVRYQPTRLLPATHHRQRCSDLSRMRRPGQPRNIRPVPLPPVGPSVQLVTGQ